MITWLQTAFQKHHKIIFGLLLATVIVTFVLTIGPQSYFGGPSTPRTVERTYFGINLAHRGQVELMVNKARLSAVLNPNDPRLMRTRLEDYAYSRVAALHLAESLALPKPTRDQLTAYLRERSAFHDQQGQFDVERYNQFMQSIQGNNVFSENLVIETLIEDFRIDRLTRALGGPGFVLPFEVLQRLLDEETVWTLATATLQFSAFQPEIEADDSAHLAFYDANPARYEEPEMVDLRMVEFPVDSFLPEVPEPSEAAILSYYAANEARFRRPAVDDDGVSTVPTEPTPLDEVRDEVLSAWRLDQARRRAQEAANAFTIKLFRSRIARDSPAFDAAREEFRGTIVDLDPFPRNRLPFQLGLPSAILTAAFSLDNDSYFSDIANTRNGAAVLIYDRTVKPRIPDFLEVESRVARDYREDRRRQLFTEHGESLRYALQDALAQGQPFAEAAEALGLTVLEPPPFRTADPPTEIDRETFQSVRRLAPGEVSPMLFQRTRGTFAHLVQRDIPEIQPDDPRVAAMLSETRSMLGLADAWSLIGEYAAAEYTRLNVPAGLLN